MKMLTAGTVMMSNNSIRQHQPQQQQYQQQSQQIYSAATASLAVLQQSISSNYGSQPQQQQQQEQQQHYYGAVASTSVSQQSDAAIPKYSAQRHQRNQNSSSSSPSPAPAAVAPTANMMISSSYRQVDENIYRSANVARKQARRNEDANRNRDEDDGDDGGGRGGDDENEANEKKIQVQILPQDDNWGQNTTAMTGDLSGVDFNDDMTEDGRSTRGGGGFSNPFQTGRPPSSSHSINDHLGARHSQHKSGLLKRLCRFMSDHGGRVFATLVFASSFLTPVLFALLPRLVGDWLPSLVSISTSGECSLECEGLLIGIAFKLFVLLLGYWFMYVANMRRANKLPRMCGTKVLIVFALVLVTSSYWLVYLVRFVFVTGAASSQAIDYFKVLQFNSSYVDVLLFVFVVGVFIIELRHRRSIFIVRVIRSPDGEQREYDLGSLSIQEAAAFILDRYYCDFKVYNPWAEANSFRRKASQFFGLEQIDAKKRARALASASSIGSAKRDMNQDTADMESTYRRGRNGGGGDVQSITNIVGTNMSVSDRLFEESELEKRVRRRRARLMVTTEEAFTHVRRIQTAATASIDDDIESSGPGDLSSSSMADTGQRNRRHPPRTSIMDPIEAAQAVLTSIARDLRRYLRATNQQAYFTRPQIIAHLADCISYDMSPKAFLQKFIAGECLLFNERALVNPFNQEQLLAYREKLIKKQRKEQQLEQQEQLKATLVLKTLDQTWILISDNALCQTIEDNLMIVLKQNEVTLMCHFKRLPRLRFIEDVLDPKRNKFIFKLNSETTV